MSISLTDLIKLALLVSLNSYFKILLLFMSKRYSGKSFKDSSIKKKAKLSFKEKRKAKKSKLIIKFNKIFNKH